MNVSIHISTLFIWFILYSMIGWIYETIYCSIKSLKWDNRGMLIGPYCPIYGVGAVLDVLLCSNLPDAGTVFICCMLGSCILEYATSYATERLFHAVWWDYSSQPLNLHGRICMGCALGFGAAGLIVLYGIHPYMTLVTGAVPFHIQELIALLFMAVFAADCALTADSLAAINAKLDATVKAIDTQISEKYNTFIENTKQNLTEGLGTLKEFISLEEYREHRTHEEVKKTLSTMSWLQIRALRSTFSFRLPNKKHSEIGTKMKHALLFHKKGQKAKSTENNCKINKYE